MHSEARGGAYLALHIGSYRKIGASDGRARLSCTAEGSAQTYSIYGLCGRGPAASALAVSTAPILSLSRGHWRERSASQQPQRDFVNVRIRPCWVAPKSSRAWFSGSPLLSSIPTVYATPGECAPGNSRSCRTREGRPRHDVRSGRDQRAREGRPRHYVRSGCDRRHLCRDRLHLRLELPKHSTSGRLRQSPPRPKQTQFCASQCSHHLLGDALMHPSLYA